MEHIRKIINELYSLVGKVGAYSELATQIEIACSNLSKAVDEYEKETENL
ncbi:MAG: hypothetical protein MR324_08695 [Lachnospiraceae bacterium]|nr:hypothetical protein [Lachnospiraceae bacterium]